jgi:hypothetical protein
MEESGNADERPAARPKKASPPEPIEAEITNDLEGPKEDDRPAARPTEPLQPVLTQFDIVYAAMEAKKEAKKENNRKSHEDFMSSPGGPFIWGVLKVLGAVTLAALVIWFIVSTANSVGSGKFECESAVKSQLRSPSTASVSFLTNSQSSENSSNWKHTGTVTAQNGFGATVTSGWTCYFEDGVARATVG